MTDEGREAEHVRGGGEEEEQAEPPERTFARANGKPDTQREDVPAFDRANREDLARERHRHGD